MYSLFRSLFITVLLFFITTGIYASVLIEVTPVTSSVIMLHFDDGYVDHHSLGETKLQDITYIAPLDIERTGDISEYLISGANKYQAGLHPLDVGRKSRGKDFSGNSNEGFPIVKEHMIYLVLPYPLEEGKEYSIIMNGLAENADTVEFNFNSKSIRTETLHVNQVGYSPEAQVKLAYLSHWMGDLGPADLDQYIGQPFYLIEEQDNNTVFEGIIEKRKDLETGRVDGYSEKQTPYGSFTGSDVLVCDFSGLRNPGKYKISVPGLGCSFPFIIDPDAYRNAFHTVTRALYHQRCGTELETDYTEWVRERCHHPAETDTVILSDWRYMDKRNAFSELPLYASDEKKAIWGGWHDAADWDKRTEHLEGTRYLLLVYDLKPDNFIDMELNIPESGNGIPDVLDEAKWNIDFFMRLQDSDGGIRGGVETTGHPHAGIGSVEDRDQWYAYGKDPFVSFSFAGTAGQLAICFQKAGFDSLSNIYKESAIQAYEWAFKNQISEESVMNEIRDERHYASSVLYRLTGNDKYQQQFISDNQIQDIMTNLYIWQKHDQNWGCRIYCLTAHENQDYELRNIISQAIINWSETNIIDPAKSRGYRFGSNMYAPTGWGTATTPEVFDLAMAYLLGGDPSYLSFAYTNCDYVLGANPLNMCWVTGMGSRSPQELMHLDSRYYHKTKGIVPGLIPFGPAVYTEGAPDGHWQEGHAYKALYPQGEHWPSHEMYFENQYCAKTNEFTVHKPVLPAAAAFGLLSEPYYNDLSNVMIYGEDYQDYYQQGINFFVDEIPGATYHWEVPASATIISGQDSASLNVNWGCDEGPVKLGINYEGKIYEISKMIRLKRFSIEGPETINISTENIIYSVQAPDSFDIKWSSKGNINFSSDITEKTVNASINGPGTIYVEITSSCGHVKDSLVIEFGENQFPYPDKDKPHLIPGTIKSAWFDTGGEGISYHDSDPENNGPGIRQDESVDTEEKDGSQTIGWVVSNEWLEYTVNVLEPAYYDFSVRVASPNDQGKFRLRLDGELLFDSLLSVNTDSWAEYTTLGYDSIYLEQKTAVLRLEVLTGGFNIGDMNFARVPLIPDKIENFKENKSQLKIFPNPASDFLILENTNYHLFNSTYRIINIHGEILKQDKINSKNQGLNLQELQRGFYIIQIYTPKGCEQISFVKN